MEKWNPNFLVVILQGRNSSRITAQGSSLKVHRSRFTATGSLLKVHRSRFTAQGSF
jgi:hypothetical protein